MTHLSDIEIAQAATAKPIIEIGAKLGIPTSALQPYGHTKAKIDYGFIKQQQSNKNGKLILVTAISPTPAGEGKTTTTVGLGDGLSRIGKKSRHLLARTEPRSLLRCERWCCWWWLLAGYSHGRHQPALHR